MEKGKIRFLGISMVFVFCLLLFVASGIGSVPADKTKCSELVESNACSGANFCKKKIEHVEACDEVYCSDSSQIECVPI